MIRKPRLLKSDLSEERRIEAVSWSVTENSTPLSTASIDLVSGENLPDRAWVEVYTPNGSAGIFRVRTPSDGYGESSSTVELEHGITELGDYLVEAEIEQQKALNIAIPELFAHYTQSAGNNAYWQLATFNYTDTVTVSVDYDNVLEAILGVLDQTPYYLTFNFNTSPWTVSVSAIDSNVSAEGRLGRNVLSAQVQRDDSELATRVFASYSYTENEEQKTGWIHDDADNTVITKYGIVEKKLDDEYDDAESAHAAAQKELTKCTHPKYSINISGFDFSSITGETLDNIRCGKKYRFAIEGESNPVEEIVKTVTWSGLPDNGYAVSISLAEEDDYLIKTLNSQKSINKSNRRSSKKTKDQLNEISYDFYSEDGYLQSSLYMNYERLFTSFRDLESGYRSLFEMTASHITWALEDSSGLHGSLEATASQLTSVYDDLNCNVKSTLQQTASTISAVVQGTGVNAHIKPAVIQASIDAATSSSKILLSADHIELDGAVITNSLDAEDDITVGEIDCGGITIGGTTTVDPYAPLVPTGGDSDYDWGDVIVHAEVVSGHLRLWKLSDADSSTPSISFSSATSLSGSWSGREFRVTASPQGETKSGFVWEHLVPIGSESVSGKWVYRDFGVYSEDTLTFEADQKLFQENIGINATGVYNAGWDAVVLSDPDWQYPAANHQSDNTTASNSVIVAASAKTDGTERKKTIPIGIYEDVSGKSAYVSAGGYKRAVVSCSNIYKAGWDAAEGDSYLPTSGNTATATMTAKKPNSTVDGTQISQTYTVSVDSSYGYIKTTVNGVNTTVARVSHSYKYTQSEYDAALATVPAGYIAESGVTAGTSSIVWDSTNAKLYNYGYAYKSGSSSPIATSTKRESSVLSISQDSGATYNNYAASYKTVRVKLGTNDILTTNVQTPWFDYDPDATVNQGTFEAGAKLKLHWGDTVLGVWQIPSSSGTVTVTDWSWNGLSNSDQSVKQKINFTVTCHVKVNGTQYTSSGLTTGNLWLKKNGIYAYLMKGNTQLANLEIRTSAPS